MMTLLPQQIEYALKLEKISSKAIRNIMKRLEFYNKANERGEMFTTGKELDESNLSIRTKKALKMKKIYTEQQLKDFVKLYGWKGLNEIRGIGEKSLEEIRGEFPWIEEF